ncbi:glycoside hydrolase family protein [Pontiellaceae bacterium B12227]|nr:glycoside hydrolase family protein [Pontiellaceae bacterium B12227]
MKASNSIHLCSVLSVSLLLSAACSSQPKAPEEQSNPYMVRHDSLEVQGNEIYHSLGRVHVEGGYRDDNYWVWGSSIIKGDDGKYHMYVSRWPKGIKFHPGWMVASEIVHATADQPEGPYEFSDVALGPRSPQFWDGCSQFNPKVFKHEDTYILFYTGSTHPFADAREHLDEVVLGSNYSIIGRSNKRIGIATSKSPNGPWTRMDQPILDVKPDTFYSFLTSNPTPVVHDDGSVLLIFKARQYNQEFPYHGGMLLGVAKAPHYTGPYTVVMDEPIFSDERFGVVEDPFLWQDETGYHMLAKDQHGKVGGVFQGGILAHSQDGLAWTLDENPTAYTKMVKWVDGTERQMGQLERVQGLVQDGKLTHLTFAVMDGRGGFDDGKNTWNIVIPLEDAGE